jgi:serine/threonine protein kinase
VKCLIDVLRGLEYLHENGYFHCDIKPNNILVGDHGEYLLTDYGITCYSPTHEAVQPRQCYLPHTSPETISNNTYDERTDIYQLGLTAFRLMNGISEIKNDFASDINCFRESVLQGNLITDNKYQAYIPRKIRRIISKAIAINPEDRYQSALEMRRALEQLSLRGTCTSDVNGNIIIISKGNSYRYEAHPITSKKSDFLVLKKNLKSGRETRATRYCVCIKNSEIYKKILNLVTDLL